MRLAVYTAVFGGHDWLWLKEPAVPNPEVSWTCFTDRDDLESRTWEVVRLANPPPGDDPERRASRAVKTCPHLFLDHGDAWLWIDSRCMLLVDPLPLARELLVRWDVECAAMRHPDRNTVREECEAIVAADKAPERQVREQLAFYERTHRAFLDGQKALTTAGFLLRRRCPRVLRFNELWWAEVSTRCLRDQMSIDLAAHLAGMTIHHLTGHYRENPYSRWSMRP